MFARVNTRFIFSLRSLCPLCETPAFNHAELKVGVPRAHRGVANYTYLAITPQAHCGAPMVIAA